MSWCRALLLPLLLFLQQAAFVHEIGHYRPDQARDEQHQPSTAGVCELCLAFAGVESIACAPAVQAQLLNGLSFALVPAAVNFVRAAHAPARRIRGPPAVV